MYVRFTFFAKDFRERRISTAFFRKILQDNPNARGFHGVMADDNRDAIAVAQLEGMTYEEAVKMTPFYRALSELGFTKVRTHFRRTHVLVYR